MIEKTDQGLRVTGPMLIANASALLEAGRDFLRAGGAAAPIVVDLAPVEEADSSALSVVFGLLRTARAQGVTLRVAHPPASMVSLAELYGVADSLPLA
jgi:phospholipid transport system transporter-binding protein